jgi:hypothetical protein
MAVHSRGWLYEGGIILIWDNTGLPRSIMIHTASKLRSESENSRGHSAIALMVPMHTDSLTVLHTAFVITADLLQKR